MSEIERLALKMWREREMTFPRFVRRMMPDDLDRATGAWALMLAQAMVVRVDEVQELSRPSS